MNPNQPYPPNRPYPPNQQPYPPRVDWPRDPQQMPRVDWSQKPTATPVNWQLVIALVFLLGVPCVLGILNAIVNGGK